MKKIIFCCFIMWTNLAFAGQQICLKLDPLKSDGSDISYGTVPPRMLILSVNAIDNGHAQIYGEDCIGNYSTYSIVSCKPTTGTAITDQGGNGVELHLTGAWSDDTTQIGQIITTLTIPNVLSQRTDSVNDIWGTFKSLTSFASPFEINVEGSSTVITCKDNDPRFDYPTERFFGDKVKANKLFAKTIKSLVPKPYKRIPGD